MGVTDKPKKVLFDENDAIYDQSHRAGAVLESILSGDRTEPQTAAGGTVQVPVEKERAARPIIEQESGRTASRVLFVTRDTSFLQAESAVSREYAALSEWFDEVHVMVLVARKGEDASMRHADRLWVYSVYSPYWWMLPFRARSAAEEALVFNGNVRPDIVVGLDPFESGFGAYLIAGAFARPLQIHLAEDFNAPSFLARDTDNRWRRRLARYVLRRTKSVRTHTGALQELVSRQFKNVLDLDTLPKFYNFKGYIGATPSFNLHERHKEFAFIALTFGPLTATSHLHAVFAALHQVLRNPRIGLIVIGDGPAKQLFVDKVRILGIERNVVFASSPDDLVSYMRTADALVEADTSRESEEHIMRAAAAGLPIVAVATDLRNDLFKDGTSAFLVPPDDSYALSQKFVKFLNSPALRKQFAQAGEQIAAERLVEDADSYHRAYRDSIEIVLEKTPEETKKEEAPKEQIVETSSGTRAIAPDGMSYPVET